MLANGVPLVTVSKILGHSSPTITAAIYAHALNEYKAEAIAGLSQKLEQHHGRTTHTPAEPTQNPLPQEGACCPTQSLGAEGGIRTRTGLPPTVFKTVASAIPPLRHSPYIIPAFALFGCALHYKVGLRH